MGHFRGMLENVSTLDPEQAANQLNPLLIKSETVETAYKIMRDLFVFTNKRLLVVDKHGVTGKKVSCHSVPYPNISHFSVESEGNYDTEAELKVWVSGSGEPVVSKKFEDWETLNQVQRHLASACM